MVHAKERRDDSPQSLEVEKLLLEKHYDLLKYYSSKVFHAWLAGAAVYLLIWERLMAFGQGGPAGKILGLERGPFMALGGSIAVALLSLMGLGYYSKYLRVRNACYALEKELCPKIASALFCKNYKPMSHWAAYTFQILAVVAMSAYGVTMAPQNMIAWIVPFVSVGTMMFAMRDAERLITLTS